MRLSVLKLEKFWANWDDLVTLHIPILPPTMSQLLQLDTLCKNILIILLEEYILQQERDKVKMLVFQLNWGPLENMKLIVTLSVAKIKTKSRPRSEGLPLSKGIPEAVICRTANTGWFCLWQRTMHVFLT